MQSIVLVAFSIVAVCSAEKVRFHGKITFQGHEPEKLPAGSHLFVEIAETSLADAPSHHIGGGEVSLKDYTKGKALRYDVTVDDSEIKGIYGDPGLKVKSTLKAHEISVSATLNVGWTPSGRQWIHHKDYTTDTMFTHRYVPGKTDYQKDIFLVRYEN